MNHQPEIELSVVLVNHDAAEVLPLALQALAANTATPSVECIIVDSGSTDDSWKNPERDWAAARSIHFEGNIGFATACNRGAELARGRLLAFVNNDGLVEPNWDAPLRSLMEDPGVQVATGLLLSLDGGMIQAAGLDVAPNMAVYGRHAFEPRERAPSEPTDVTAATGALMMVRRDEFLADGGFYEPGWMFGEETDFALRALARGRIVLHPDSALRHESGHSAGGRNSTVRLYWSTRNKLVNAARHLPTGTLARSVLLSAVYDLSTIALYPSVRNAQTLARGWRDGVRRMPAERRARTPAERRRAAAHLASLRTALLDYARIERSARVYVENGQGPLEVEAEAT